MGFGLGKVKKGSTLNKQHAIKKRPRNKHGSANTRKKRLEEDIDNMQVDSLEKNNTSEALFQRIRKKKSIQSKNFKDANKEEKTRVAVRQKSDHKLILYFFEQLLLKHHIDERFPFDCEEVSHGIDFLFDSPMNATKFMEFCETVIPCRSTKRKENDFFVELGSVCVGDVVCLPQRLYNKIGGKLGPIVICCKVSREYHFIDPKNGSGFKMNAQDFFKYEVKPLFSYRQMEKFIVLDVRITEGKIIKKKYVQGEVQVQKNSQVGQHLDSMPITCNCHFSHIIQPGDIVLGYDFINSNSTDDIESTFKRVNFADIILIRRYEELSKKRIFELQSLCLEREDDFEHFLDEIEIDKEMRSNINLYKNPNYEPPAGESKLRRMVGVSLDELLEGLSL